MDDFDTQMDLETQVAGLAADLDELTERVRRLEAVEEADKPEPEPESEPDRFEQARQDPRGRLMELIGERGMTPRAAAQRVVGEIRHAQHGPWRRTRAQHAKELLESAGYPPSLGGRSVNAVAGLVPARAHDFADEFRRLWEIHGAGLVGFRRQELDTLGLDWRDFRILGGEDPEEEGP